MKLLESGDHCDLQFKYKTHLSKYKLIIKEKSCMSDHWPLRATKVVYCIVYSIVFQYTENSNLRFSSKNDTFRIWDHCDLQFKYKTHLSKYKNK